MNIRWIGAILIVAGCGGFGFSIAAGYRREQRRLRELRLALSRMEWELEYRLTPLPELCASAGREAEGAVGAVLRALARELERGQEPDAAGCMRRCLRREQGLSARLRHLLTMLGRSLGRYDLPGQLQGLRAVREACREEEQTLQQGQETRLRSYQTLGICAGAALVILLA